MDKATQWVLVVLAAITVCFATGAFADNLRLEAAAGTCKYGKGEDGSWYKQTYPSNFHLVTGCYSVSLSKMVWPTPGGMLGWRVGYVDFGLAKAETYVPVVDSEANLYPSGQNCNKATKSGCVGFYEQQGRARGIAFGPVLEKKTQWATVGVETGLYRFTSYWRVHGTEPGPGTCDSCVGTDSWDWNGAQGTHTTWYAGITLESHGFYLQARRFNATYASQTQIDPRYIGLIGGPLYSVQVGYQLRF